MNVDQERYQPGPAAAVAGNSDTDNAAGDDNNNNNIDNIEQQPLMDIYHFTMRLGVITNQ